MVTDVVLPQMGLEVTEGLVTSILVAVGDEVSEGATVVEVETDKAIAEVPATRDGIVAGVLVEVGDTVPVGAVLIRIADDGEEDGSEPATQVTGDREAAIDAEAAADLEAASAEPVLAPTASASAAAPQAGPADASASAAAPQAGPAEETAQEHSLNGAHRRRAAPIARRAASRFGISLEQVTGTGPGGRITLGDVERVAGEGAAAPAGPAPQPSSGERLEPLSATRQAIARRLTESQLVPQYTLSRDVDATWVMAEKARLTAAGPVKVGVVDLLLQALAEALARHPQLAASFVPGAEGGPPHYRHPEGIDLGLAVATERGLLVPVIRRVDELTLAGLVAERGRLVDVARGGRLGIADMSGAASTLSSLGTFGVDRFTAMLNPGESSILAVGRTVERAVPRERGFAVVPTLTLTFTFDHRVVDGATGAPALAELAELLEGGMTWRT